MRFVFGTLLPFLAACATQATLDVDGKPHTFALTMVQGKPIHAGPKAVDAVSDWSPRLREMIFGDPFGGEGKLVLHLKGCCDLTLLLETPIPASIGALSPPELRGAVIRRIRPMCGTLPFTWAETLPIKEGFMRLDRTGEGETHATLDIVFTSRPSDEEARTKIRRELGINEHEEPRNLHVRGVLLVNLEQE